MLGLNYLGATMIHDAIQLQQIARRFNINFGITRSKSTWSRIRGLSADSISSCIEFQKLGGFFKGVKISANSKYHKGIQKDVYLLGILEFKRRQKIRRKLRNLSLRNIHNEINKIIKNREYNSQGYYINYFS